MGQEGSGGIAAYYDNLSSFLDVARWFGRGGGAQEGATHRFLASPDGETSTQAVPERLDHIVLAAAMANGLPHAPKVLDAGCGIGGTIFRWHERVGGSYAGLTLSPEQQRRASAEALRRGISASCQFHLRSYHDPLLSGPHERSFDAVIAIESLAHSPDPAAAVRNFAAALAPGGLLVIVDDMPVGQVENVLRADFKSRWRCPVLADAGDFRAAIEASGLKIVQDDDLTSLMRPRPLAWLRVLIAGFRLLRRLAPTRGMRDVLDALLGGFLLEALYRTGGMRYRMIVAAQPQVGL